MNDTIADLNRHVDASLETDRGLYGLSNKGIARAAQRAHDWIADVGWTQHDYENPGIGAGAAIYDACCDPLGGFHERLCDALEMAYREAAELGETWGIDQWNDWPGRTEVEVLTAFLSVVTKHR